MSFLYTIQRVGFQSKARRMNIAGLPKGLPPKIINNRAPLTPAEIQEKEQKQRFVVKTFYKTGVKWTPHPKLAKCDNIPALEHYLWDHHLRLRWFRGQIGDESRNTVRRRYLRTHISIHKLTVNYIESKILQLKGELAIPRLLPDNAPWYWHSRNPFVNQLNVTHRIQRSYDYPHKNILEPLARQQAESRGETLLEQTLETKADLQQVQQYMHKSVEKIRQPNNIA
jgi:hypothetical protein